MSYPEAEGCELVSEQRGCLWACERSRNDQRDPEGGSGTGPSGKTDRTPHGDSSRQTSSGNHPPPAPPAPGHVAVEGTSLKSRAPVRQGRPQPSYLPSPTPRPWVSPSAHWQTSAEHKVDKSLLLVGAP